MSGELIKASSILSIGQRLEVYADSYEGGEVGYSSRIEDIIGDELLIAMPLTSKRVPVIPNKGENLYVLAAGPGCHYRFFSTQRGTSYRDGRIPVLHIAAPEYGERYQKRKAVRVRVNLTVSVRLVDTTGTIYPAVKTHVLDLSGTGISFVWNQPIEIGSGAGLEINDIPGLGTLELISKVVRCSRVERDDDASIYHVGAAFEGVSPSVREKIIHYLFSVQRQELQRMMGDY